MKVKFLGAAGTVTGSGYILTSQSDQSILIDLGMFQGPKEIEKLNYDPLDWDCSQLIGGVLTHAHLDHCGRLPILIRKGFKAPIWMTSPTRDLTELSLNDSAKVGREDRGDEALYGKDDVKQVVDMFKTVDYETVFTIGPFSIVMRDAGHILGSASLEITDLSSTSQYKKIVFSGDLGNTPEELVRPTEYIASADAVVMESTYGDKAHPAEDPEDVVISEINAVEASGGTLLIPAFSLERTQELLHMIAHAKSSARVQDETPVFLDSPMAERATEIYEKYPTLFNSEVRSDFQKKDPFDFPGLAITMKREDAKIIGLTNGPKVIIAGSGMMTGGRILNHAIAYLGQDSTRLLIVGYQGEGTLGRQIAEGGKHLSIEGVPVQVKATVSETHAMSSHADQPRLISWLKKIGGVKQVILTHGENMQRNILKQKLQTDLAYQNTKLPELNQQLELD